MNTGEESWPKRNVWIQLFNSTSQHNTPGVFCLHFGPPDEVLSFPIPQTRPAHYAPLPSVYEPKRESTERRRVTCACSRQGTQNGICRAKREEPRGPEGTLGRWTEFGSRAGHATAPRRPVWQLGVFSFKLVTRSECAMTSPASDLPDWRVRIPTSGQQLLLRAVFHLVVCAPTAEETVVWLRVDPRSSPESVFCAGEGGIWEKSWPLLNHLPSLTTRAHSVSLQDTPRRC